MLDKIRQNQVKNIKKYEGNITGIHNTKCSIYHFKTISIEKTQVSITEQCNYF